MKQAEEYNVSEVFQEAAHLVEEMVIGCSLKGVVLANCPALFTPVLTDMGHCFTFNKNGTLSTERAAQWLKIQLDVQQDEYFGGPATSAGFRVRFNHPIINSRRLPTMIAIF